ncbi:hypothetical protein LCGC14_1038570 [marine sediment metagenome]|uniref:Class I SAM-dependent methyltransferase n=1 Tax=marine sediment metagenome TaxID=412755 RepID=A0A0F9QYL8_9ZZZZ
MNSIKNLYWKIPIFLRKAIFIIYSKGMRLLNPIILLKLNKGKFLNKEIKEINNINDAIKFAFSFQYLAFTIRTGQIKYEIIKLLEIIKDLNSKIILEIGTAGGGTLFLFTKVAEHDSTIISVDLPGGNFGGGYTKWKIPIYQSFTKRNQKIKLFREDSHNPETFKLIKNFLENKKIDFLFIDGDHTYDGVKKDFEMYSGLVKKGGIIAFHDIAKCLPEVGCEVSRYWNEIKHDYQFLEIIEDTNQKWAGIGVLYIK